MKEVKTIDLTFRLTRQRKEVTKQNVDKEVEKLRAEGKQITHVMKVNGRWYAYYKD